MTVADNTSRNQYTATPSQALFAYTFEIVDKDDIVVLINGIPLSEGTDYTVTGVGSDTGGNIVLTSGTTGGNIVTIYRDMPYARTQNYTNSGDFLASEVNSDFDSLWLAGEQTNRAFEQSVRKPITDSDSISMELPEASSRANKLLGFDATGAVSTSLVTDDAETIAGIAADIETLAHIQDGTVATDAITNVNTIRTDVTAVSGVASDVTAVAGNTANINTVASDLTGADDIGTVAGSISNVDTVAGDIANVNSVAGNSTNINTVAADLSGADDIGTVAGSISSVNTVAPDINHVVTVSGDLAGADNIGTVATNISNVNAVGGISSDVTTVAGISTEVTAVSSNSANVNTVGTNITNVNNVGSNIANVNTVAGLETEINAVVADAADIGVVGANITSVNTVSSNIASVNAVYNNMSDVNNAAANATAAAASAADANTSAGAAATSANAASTSASNASSSESAALTSANNASQSAATASLSASAAATSATNASSSAANAATSESNADNSETAAAISASNASSSASTASNNAIAAASSATSASNSASQAASSASAAATSATNSETAADTWNSYYSTYLGASATAPSYDLLGQPLQNGALYFNTTDDTMYVFNGSIWIAAESTINIVSVPTQLAADLTTNGNDIIFGDNDKAVFGAGNDLQIFHDGSNSRIKDNGTGGLYVQGSSFISLTNAAATETYVYAAENGAVQLKYDNSTKLATTSTGVDVTGTVTADGLTVDGNAEISGASNGLRLTETDTTNLNSYITNQAGTLRFRSANDAYNSFTTRLQLDHATGDISFYEDTGTTAKFFWDASTERLGIGNSAPTTDLDVTGTVTADDVQSDLFGAADGTVSNPSIRNIGDSNTGFFFPAADTIGISTGGNQRINIGSGGDISFYDAAGTSQSFFWDASVQRLGIGTTSPATDFDVAGGTSSSSLTLSGRSDNSGALVNVGNIYGRNQNASFNGARIKIDVSSTAGNIQFQTATGGSLSEAMRIDSDGNVGIGTTSPDFSGFAEKAVTIATSGSNSQAILELAGNNSASNTWIGGIAFINQASTDPGGNGGRISQIAGYRDAGDNDAGALLFSTASTGGSLSEKMRINSSGTLLVGKSSSGFTAAGHEINADGLLVSTRDGDNVVVLNRETNDGSILQFRKDNSTVGSIGANATRLYIASSDTGLRFVNDDIRATNGSGADVDGTKDLGDPTSRFKDLYLSGGAYLGGIASANKLDDFEEGTWTPVASNYSGTMTVNEATYTKIGDSVVSRASVSFDATTDASGVSFTGLPFNHTGENKGNGGFVTRSSVTSAVRTRALGVGTISLRDTSDTGVSYTTLASTTLEFQFIYRTTS